VLVCPCQGTERGQSHHDHRLPRCRLFLGCHHGCLSGRRPPVTTRGADQTAGPRDDHAVGLVAPLHQCDVDIV
jgi:hypothetical protein